MNLDRFGGELDPPEDYYFIPRWLQRELERQEEERQALLDVHNVDV